MIELLDKNEIKEGNSEEDIKKDDKKDIKKDSKDDKKLNFITKDKMRKCGRADLGLVNNCAICQSLNNEIFKKCQNKWS